MRCAVCNKRVGVLGFSCPCDDQIAFCATHRLPETHSCPTLTTKKPVVLIKVVADKVKNRL
jgi:predicted nucleic acid binding AN1-type Zn finger protein